MSAPKTLTVFGAELAVEAGGYNQGQAVTGADGCELAENPRSSATLDYLYDGLRPAAQSGGGWLRQNSPSGRFVEGTLKYEMKGRGSVYSGVNFPPNIVHRTLLASGHNVATDTTGGAESQTYTPEVGPSGFDSLGGRLYAAGEYLTVAGGLGSLRLAGDELGAVMAEWRYGCTAETAVAEAAPASTYAQGAIIPPKNTGVTLSINGVTTLIVRSWNWTDGRERFPRRSMASASGHGGWTLGPVRPVMEVLCESLAIGTFNPYTLRSGNTEFAVSLQVGAAGAPGQYNRFTISQPTCHIFAHPYEEDSETALWRLVMRPHVLPGANNSYLILFN